MQSWNEKLPFLKTWSKKVFRYMVHDKTQNLLIQAVNVSR